MRFIDSGKIKKMFGKKENLFLYALLSCFTLICLFRILKGGELSGDEFFSLEDSYGRAFFGVSQRWDFIARSGNGVLFDYSKKYNAYFILLGCWMRLFGVTEISMRLLSLLWGVGAILSLYIFVKKCSGSFGWSVASSLTLAFYPGFVSVCTTVREYSMLTCLNIWLFYCIYRVVNSERFSWKYFTIAAALAFIAFFIRIFEAIYLLGIGVYIMFKAVRTKKKELLILTGIGVAGIFSFFSIFAFHLDRYGIIFQKITELWGKYTAIGFKNYGYVSDVIKILFWPISLCSLGMLAHAFLKKGKEEQKELVLFLLCIVIGTLFCFITFVDWPEDIRYVIAVYPMAAVLITSGFFLNMSDIASERKEQYFLYGLLTACFIINFISACPKNLKAEPFRPYSQAYTRLAEYAGGEPFFITGIRLRGFYANDILGKYQWRALTSKGDDPEINHLEEFCTIAGEHPQGYLYCESDRWYHLRNGFWNFLNMDAFEKVTGSGIDNTGVNIWAYHLIFPTAGEIGKDGETTIFGECFGGRSRIDEKDGKTVLQLELNGNMPSKMLLGLKVNQYHDGVCTKRYAQLVLLPNYGDRQYYEVVFENAYAVDKSELDNSYCFYDGEEPKAYEDCYKVEK